MTASDSLFDSGVGNVGFLGSSYPMMTAEIEGLRNVAMGYISCNWILTGDA